MKRFKVFLNVFSVALVAALAFAAGFLANEASKINEAREEKEAGRQLVIAPPTEVALLRLEPRPYEERLSYTGVVQSWRSATLSFAEIGTVSQFFVDKDDPVRGPCGDEPGAVLATLDKVKFEATAKAAKADLDKARWERDNTRSLHEQGTASEEELRAMTLLCTLKESQLARARKALEDTTLRAPFTGVIAERFIEPGETASPQRPAYRLIQVDRVKVLVSIPGRRINEVKVGQRAEVEVETRIGESVTLPGKVHTVPPAAVGRLFEVEIAVENKEGILKEGMIARTVIYTRVSRNLFVLPLESVIQAGDRRKVMVAAMNGKVADGFFDLALLPPRIAEGLAGKGWDLSERKWRDLPREEWESFELTSVEQLKARVPSPHRGVPQKEKLNGLGLRVVRTGHIARERVLKSSRVEGDLCLVPDDGTLQPGEMLIVRGQHRASDGGEVVESERNELPPPVAGEYR